MKFKKTTAIAVTACIAGSAIFSLAGCGDGGLGHGVGEKPIGDRTEIFFYCDGNEVSEKGWLELIEAYNDGAGYETDQVYVTADIEAGISSSSGNEFIQDTDYAYNVVAINDGQNGGFQSHVISRDSRYAPNGYFLNLQSYADKDEDFKKNEIRRNRRERRWEA